MAFDEDSVPCCILLECRLKSNTSDSLGVKFGTMFMKLFMLMVEFMVEFMFGFKFMVVFISPPPLNHIFQ